ncbi:phosphatidylinositol N-acetylglucosaminyltransferase subunit P-like [Clytia hemisphaerica]|uniref:PIG-P domain-containing protein n=1 Tax=Clytia hemisphaerica TaxID=252671 RepID=A0A7M5V5E5_9CNID|eukprot:TCONS_00039205-protein
MDNPPRSQPVLEHNPCPTPSRAIYGFVLYVVSYVLYGAYILWALIPDEYLATVGITYIPARHWVITFPLLMYLGIIMLVVVYSLLYWINSSEMTCEEPLTKREDSLMEFSEDLNDLDDPVVDTTKSHLLIGKHSLRKRVNDVNN